MKCENVNIDPLGQLGFRCGYYGRSTSAHVWTLSPLLQTVIKYVCDLQ